MKACPELAEGMKTGDFILPPSSFILSLADGTRLALCAGDETAARVLDFLARAAELSPALDPLPPGVRRLLVATDVGQNGILSYANAADALCVLAAPDAPRRRTKWDRIRSEKHRRAGRVDPEPLPEEQWFWQQLARLSAAIASEIPSGGVLLHSGLAELLSPSLSLPGCAGPWPRWGRGLGAGFPLPAGGGQGEGEQRHGILLAGRSGVGKSTASRRLPPPWRALADDVTLVVQAEDGAYWAHPWPTWSRFFGDEAGDGSDTWDVQRAAPLRTIVVLEQGPVDRIEPLGPAHTVALLSELAQQASRYLVQGMPRDELAAFYRQRFDNLCALARAVPAYLLHVSRGGAFWTEIERAIEQQPGEGSGEPQARTPSPDSR